MLAHLDEERSKVDVHEWRIIADAACSEGACSGQRWGPLQCPVMRLMLGKVRERSASQLP